MCFFKYSNFLVNRIKFFANFFFFYLKIKQNQCVSDDFDDAKPDRFLSQHLQLKCLRTINNIIRICFSSDVCQLPILFYTTSSQITYYSTIGNTTTTAKFVDSTNSLLAYDKHSRRLYFYNLTKDGTIFNANLDSSDIQTVISLTDFGRFTVGKYQNIYYIHGLSDNVQFVNVTSKVDTVVSGLSSATGLKDIHMDTRNG